MRALEARKRQTDGRIRRDLHDRRAASMRRTVLVLHRTYPSVECTVFLQDVQGAFVVRGGSCDARGCSISFHFRMHWLAISYATRKMADDGILYSNLGVTPRMNPRGPLSRHTCLAVDLHVPFPCTIFPRAVIMRVLTTSMGVVITHATAPAHAPRPKACSARRPVRRVRRAAASCDVEGTDDASTRRFSAS